MKDPRYGTVLRWPPTGALIMFLGFDRDNLTVWRAVVLDTGDGPTTDQYGRAYLAGEVVGFSKGGPGLWTVVA